MADWRASSGAKIGRARQHLEHLKTEFRDFAAREPYEVRQEFDPQTGRKRLIYYPTEELTLDWSVVLGDLLYDLRSALDHIVHDLGGGVPRSEFPIFDDSAAFHQAKRNGQPTERSGLYKIRGDHQL
jgi:hypothetical protein